MTNAARKYVYDIFHDELQKPSVNLDGFKIKGSNGKPLLGYLTDTHLRKLRFVMFVSKRHASEYGRSYWSHDVRDDCDKIEGTWSSVAKEIIKRKAEYANYVTKTYLDYDYGVEEPTLAIIDKMLNKPKRFHVAKYVNNEMCVSENNDSIVLIDRDTDVKFVVKYQDFRYTGELMRLATPANVFTNNEEKALCSAISNLVSSRINDILAKKRAKEEKRRQAKRQQLIEAYGA
ncbi:hypothetical protein AVU32_gp157 [Vibrio phage ValKK3]|uniref:Uncharacterized protein n=1 Tax=Vibrio phage ValKK3 TaxID=1610855 RepID=A0A0D4DBP5_9CAUD|nr:hypothetical protein AVU32_gp157 [Vibrio phage ValKK3]AJT60998.1 hypothetical protein [Vibrio phage ValKK3]